MPRPVIYYLAILAAFAMTATNGAGWRKSIPTPTPNPSGFGPTLKGNHGKPAFGTWRRCPACVRSPISWRSAYSETPNLIFSSLAIAFRWDAILAWRISSARAVAASAERCHSLPR